MKNKNGIKLSLINRHKLYGAIFALPFIIGFTLFYITPLIRSIVISFSNLTINENGLNLANIKLANYYEALFVSPTFYLSIFESVKELIILVPSIIVFSIFIALILNQRFYLRTFSRALFFMPVILYSGLLASIAFDSVTGAVNQAINSMGADSAIQLNFATVIMDNIPAKQGEFLIDLVDTATSQVFKIVTSSGVQILIFLAGIQNISPSIYEAANIEGITAWESFWKITMPILSPITLVCVIYTIIDLLGNASNRITAEITKLILRESEFGLASAMSVIYALVIIVVILLTALPLNKFVHYEN